MTSDRIASDGQPTIILDGDDTLWECETHYDQAGEACWALLLKELGPDIGSPEDIRHDLRRILSAQIEQHGYDATVYERSWIITYHHLAKIRNRMVDPDVSLALFQTAATVHTGTYTIFPDAIPTLETLAQTNQLIS